LLELLPGYNQAARFSLWFVMIDLDLDADCAPPFLQKWLPTPSQWIRFRVVVRAIEAWLMADAESLGKFLHVPVSKFPTHPDNEENPKRTLVNLVRRHSTRESIKKAIVLHEGSGEPVGRGYGVLLQEYIQSPTQLWRPEVALEHSDSLRRCVAALRTLKDWKPAE